MQGQMAEILGVGMVTPVGLSALPVAAAIRAGIVRVRESRFVDRHSEPVLAGFLDDEYLPDLAVPQSMLKEPVVRHRRMLQLATRALQEVCQGLPQPLPLLLALPEACGASGQAFLELLVRQSEVDLDVRGSKLFPLGRAGGLLALAEALSRLASSRSGLLLVGGVDSHLELPLLDALWEEGRLFVRGLSDGFVPGEGAAFVLLGRPGMGRRLGMTPMARILGVGTGLEKGHLYSQHPHLGDGLADAFQALFSSIPGELPKIRCVYAGFNGESFWSKEWGVAYLRSSRFFEEGFRMEHPVECIGDPGAALGPILLALAAIGVQRGYRGAPCLLWCGSDREERGAALVDAARR